MAIFYSYVLAWVLVHIHNSRTMSEVSINVPLTTMHPYECNSISRRIRV